MAKSREQAKYYTGWAVLFSFALVSLFLSYRPTLHFGSAGGANLELSLTQVGIGLFILASVGVVWNRRRTIAKSIPTMILTGLTLMSSLSLLWTANVTRGLLTTVLLWAILALWCALQAQTHRLVVHRTLLMSVSWWTVMVVAVFGWFQVFADALGASAVITLLPQPYVSGVFGFARPTGFALEPQFLGSLLLAPILYGVWREIRGTATVASRVLWLVSLSVLAATISRGAYLALAIGVSVVVAANWRGSIRRIVRTTGMAIGVLIASFGLLAGAAQINTEDKKNGVNAIIQAVNHLSIGALEIPFIPDEGTQKTNNTTLADPLPVGIRETGYVEESTTSRLSMTQEAFALWRESPQTVAVGVGAGGFGAALHEKDTGHSLSSIVNNQYVEVLVELGVIGALLFVALLGYIVRWCIVQRQWLVLAIVAGYVVQWNFFSGNVNVLHIWVMVGAALFIMPIVAKGEKHG